MRFAARSNRGLKRERNEDAVLANPRLGIFMVADGMGGHKYGEEASRLAVEAVQKAVENAGQGADRGDVLRQALEDAHQQMRALARDKAGGHTVGTTATVLWLGPGQAQVAHVGDSRLYLLRGGALEQQTKDHTMVQEAIDLGRITAEQAANSPYANAITRALGGKRGHQPDLFTLELERGDLALLASDGLFKELNESKITAVLHNPHNSLEARADVLLEAALKAGGSDNISLVLVDPELDSPKTRGGLLAKSIRFLTLGAKK